ncbi:MAG: hypothetical protein M1823_006550, partial [Watsoniomyces obsoletus]
ARVIRSQEPGVRDSTTSRSSHRAYIKTRRIRIATAFGQASYVTLHQAQGFEGKDEKALSLPVASNRRVQVSQSGTA